MKLCSCSFIGLLAVSFHEHHFFFVRAAIWAKSIEYLGNVLVFSVDFKISFPGFYSLVRSAHAYIKPRDFELKCKFSCIRRSLLLLNIEALQKCMMNTSLFCLVVVFTMRGSHFLMMNHHCYQFSNVSHFIIISSSPDESHSPMEMRHDNQKYYVRCFFPYILSRRMRHPCLLTCHAKICTYDLKIMMTKLLWQIE